MNAHSHAFVADTDELATLALRIKLQGPRSALCAFLTAREVADWTDAAQRYLDSDGEDDADLKALNDEMYAFLNPPGWGPPDYDADWRGSSFAERSTYGMGLGR